MVTIEVTQRHIDEEGCRFELGACAAASAILDVFPNQEVEVTSARIKIGLCRYQTPPCVEAFIESFDTANVVYPFSFTLPDHDLNGKPTPEART